MSSNAVADIREKLDIVDLVSQRVTLKKTGRSFKGLCPFHQEKSPSFVVFPESQNFHCFGCGKAGDVFTFYQLAEAVDFREALTELADRAGVTLGTAPPSPSSRDPVREQALELNEITATLYASVLRESPAAAHVRAYVTSRGLDQSVIDEFRLGYAPDSWDYLLRQLSTQGVVPEVAAEIGLLQQRETGGHYDRFRNRLIFPIRNRDGAVVGFGARAMGDDQPKYLNSPQTVLFDKSALLYGLDLAKGSIRDLDQVVIVEGYMDVIAAHQVGRRNVVATMGTAVTISQVDQVKRFSKRIVLALDADAAGQQAALRAIESIHGGLDQTREFIPDPRVAFRIARGIDGEITVAELPDGRDPDEIIRSSPEVWDNAVASARPYAEFLVNKITADIPKDDAAAKRQAIDRLAPLLQRVPDQIARGHYAQLISRRLDLPFQNVQSRLMRNVQLMPPRVARKQESQAQRIPNSVEDHLVALLLRYRPLAFDLMTEIPPDDLVDARNRILLSMLKDPSTDDSASGAALLEDLDPVLADHGQLLLDSLQDRPGQHQAEVREEILQTLVRLERDRFEVLSSHLRSEIEFAESSKDEETIVSLSEQLERLAGMHRRLYPRPSPYFPDSRTKSPIRAKQSFPR